MTVAGVQSDERRWARDHRYRSIIAMTHPRAVIIFATGAWLTASIAQQRIPDGLLGLRLVLSMALVQISIGVWNEVCDRDVDALTKRWRAIPAGMISAHVAAALSALCGVGGLLIASMLGLSAARLLAVGWACGVLYSVWLKRTALSWVPYVVAYPIVPLFGWSALGLDEPRRWLVYPVTLPIVLAVHLSNQLRDYSGDRAAGIQSLVHLLGEDIADRIVVLLLVAAPIPCFASFSSWRNPELWPVLALASLLHWSVLARHARVRNRQRTPWWHTGLFRRLQIIAPLLCIAWLIVFG